MAKYNQNIVTTQHLDSVQVGGGNSPSLTSGLTTIVPLSAEECSIIRVTAYFNVTSADFSAVRGSYVINPPTILECPLLDGLHLLLDESSVKASPMGIDGLYYPDSHFFSVATIFEVLTPNAELLTNDIVLKLLLRHNSNFPKDAKIEMTSFELERFSTPQSYRPCFLFNYSPE